MQKANDQLDFPIDTPSDAELHKRYAGAMDEYKQSPESALEVFKERQTKNQRKRARRKASRA